MRMNGGKGLTWYTVTDPADDPVRPRPGTLRYGATMLRGKVWITFERDMQIKLEKPLLVKSFTTIDGRGANVQIAYGGGILLYNVNNVIIHGLQIHHCVEQPPGPVVGPGGKITQLGGLDGDAIRLVASSKVWIDHNTLYQSQDGLIDVTRGSTFITISNNWFRDHDKVMLLGHDDSYVEDAKMKVTVAFNRFGPNCNQRMPRIRHGYAHVANNLYDGWRDYAIGGSMEPRVKSEGNLFIASNSSNKKVTRRIPGKFNSWNWQSVNDVFINGAFFKETGYGRVKPAYNRQQRFKVGSANAVRALTRNAGALRCSASARC
ncbi:probable pectate lyase 16 [Typha latifolia]|uniref:probable pectate lyase 16 n=1 Tax=Typha latifolia TaxID=4733 RepID=UPI003C2ADFB6